ncbi:MAG: tetratricopeptide repeat-containing sensor histidine kinase [Bacteroidota bacterium]|nr:tetratricopeptide repeat-containing sensor histidine kinase [Bacteroidota bacterium]
MNKSFHILFYLLFCFGLNCVFAQQDTLTTKTNLRQLLQEALLKNNAQPAQATGLFEQLLKLSESEKDFAIYCECLKQLAIQEIGLGHFNDAKGYITKGSQTAETLQFPNYKADFSYLFGTIFYAQGNLPAAVQKYLEALRYYESVKQDAGALTTYTALAEIYQRQNNFSKAIEFNLKALKLFEQRNDKFRLLNIYEQVGSIYHRQKNTSKAKDYYIKALFLYKDIGNQAGEAATMINLANLDVDLNQCEPAVIRYKRALAIAAKLNAVPLQVQALNGLAKCHVNLKDYESANKEFRQAIVLAKRSGLKIELDEAYNGLSDIYKSLNNFGKMRTYRALSTEIRDSLFNDSVLKKTADLQLLYETEKKQAQIELYKKDDIVKELELKQTRQVKNFFIALSILLVLLVIVFIYFISQNRKINKALTIGLTELEVKNHEIEVQKEQLTQLNQVKDRFFSIISHDLRNNLTTMKLYFDLVSHKEFNPESHSELSKQVASSVQNTIDLLENLLVWASAQIKGVSIKPVNIKLHELAEENCQLLSSMAFNKKIQLSNQVDEDTVVFGDINMVNLILRNLLSNALKFTAENGSVSIISEDEETCIKISVIDNGVGIAESKTQSLFTDHANTSTKGTGNEKGTGLGLMLCKEFVEKSGGKIWVESEENKGSSFCFTLPKKG